MDRILVPSDSASDPNDQIWTNFEIRESESQHSGFGRVAYHGTPSRVCGGSSRRVSDRILGT